MADAVTPVARERGWRRLLPALLLFLILPAVPHLRMLAPVELTHFLLVPAIAACALAGWWAGGRASIAFVWLGLAAWMAWFGAGAAPPAVNLAKGWGVVLGAAFGLVCVLGAGRSFFARALTAIAIALLVGLGAAAFSTGGLSRLGRIHGAELDRRVVSATTGLQALERTREWQDFSTRNPGAAGLRNEAERQLRFVGEASRVAFPALLALESLAALALAWGVFHRISRTRIGPALAPLREFRFNDQLVWGLVVGTAAVVVPQLRELRGVGINLLVFFGALYLMRGLGVLTWFLAPGRLVTALLIGFAVLAWPLFGVFALGLGLGDTWLDWRSRPRPTT